MPALRVHAILVSTLIHLIIVPIAADPLDWVNVEYVARQAKIKSSSTSDAQTTISRGAASTSKSGPWSVTNSDTRAPSQNIHDYLSWAPYHWPDCNWCGNRNHLASNSSSGNNDHGLDNFDSDPYPDGGSDFEDGQRYSADEPLPGLHASPVNLSRRMVRVKRRTLAPSDTASPSATLDDVNALGDDQLPQAPFAGPPPIPTTLQSASSTANTPPTTADSDAPTPSPVQAAAKTRNDTKPTCTPSPTTSMAPSATWTKCPYKTRDGKVNPDVRTLNGPAAINKLSQSIIYNAVAYVLFGSRVHSKNIASFVHTFFLAPETKMNPNLAFGQLIRGPGATGRIGTAMGILDFRGMVKICNGIMIARAADSPDWSPKLDQGMSKWMDLYSRWLVESDIGQNAATRSNNHGTYYIAQVAAAKLLAGQEAEARAMLQRFFSSDQFGDQIAASGEQPFEAVRTRPFHYRCFNLEALITNAKIGDQLGLDFWSVKSKHGATIQSALDFIMKTDPKKEDVREVIPHVAAIAAAYGDPLGKYAAFMKNKMPNYQSRPFFFYDQTDALPSSPAASRTHKRSISSKRDDSPYEAIDFVCPTVFHTEKTTELDNGIFVSCQDLKPFYLSDSTL